MCTEQNYVRVGDSTTFTEPSASSSTSVALSAAQPSVADDDRPASITIDEFLARNAPQTQLMSWQVAPFLDQLLVNQPIQYTSILDVIPLLRTFLPASGADADYALLIRDKSIVGFVWLGAESYEEAIQLNARLLMRAILELDVKSIILVTTYSVQDSAFDEARTSHIDNIGESFYQFGVSLSDWLHIHPAHTESYMLAAHGEESIDLTEDQVNFCFDQCRFPDLGENEDEEGKGHE